MIRRRVTVRIRCPGPGCEREVECSVPVIEDLDGQDLPMASEFSGRCDPCWPWEDGVLHEAIARIRTALERRQGVAA